MRFLALAALLALSACGQDRAEAGCARGANHEITWSSQGAQDTVSARAEGPSCAQAVVTLSIRNAAGDPLWAFASTHYALQAGDGALPEDVEKVSEEEMDTFLAGWTDLSMQSSGELPQWAEGQARLTGETFSYDTPFEREAYEMLRERDLPMACFQAAAEGSQCLVIDPLSHAPTMIVAYGP